MKSEARKIALEIIFDQILTSGYSLENEKYAGLSEKECMDIENEMYKIQLQFRKRYNINFDSDGNMI